jgi:hypothetical protein
MRKNITLFFCFTILLLTPSLYGQGAEKVLVKSFNLEGNNAVKLDLPGIVDVREWDNAYVRVEMHVSVSNVTESLLRSLIEAGRYNIQGKTEDGMYVITVPGLQKQVKVGGREIEEFFCFTVSYPATAGIWEEELPQVEPVSEASIMSSSL